MQFRGYKLCKECGQPMLKKGQERKHPDDYRHALGCPNASSYEREKEARRIIEDLVRQFGVKLSGGIGPVLHHGCLSAMEEAFAFLGWENPHPCPESGCQYDGCNNWGTCGKMTKNGYKRCCSEHWKVEDRPQTKEGKP